MKLLIIDGNNLAIRSAFANSGLSTVLTTYKDNMHPDDAFGTPEDNFPTGVLHGFFRSLAMLRRSYPEHYFVVVWDGGNTRRVVLTQSAVAEGLIPELYKANRITAEPKKEILDFLKQKEDLRKALSFTNIPQVVCKDEEADDVAASYAFKYKDVSDQILLFTTDKDYYQLLSSNISILRDDDLVTAESFTSMYGIEPARWVDVGGFMGDAGDNIFGVPGWGEKTSIAAIKQYGSFEATYESFHRECDALREKFPDLSGEGFSALMNIKSPKGNQKYSDIAASTPFTGVALAIENGIVKKPKSVLNALMHEKRARLAMVLKKMVTDLSLPNLPGTLGVPAWDRKMDKEFLEFCEKYSLNEVSDSYESLCGTQPVAEKCVIG
jgi:5'-3' exonuclease